MGRDMLAVHVEKNLGEFSMNVAFTSESRATALFGPSGAGKTSLINMIAGLLRPDRGRVEVDGEVLFDSAARIDVPAWRRRIGYVFQEGRLFPHISVRHNLEYGRWMSGHKFDPAAFEHVVELLDIGHLLDRRPGKLSGGERQRILIAQSLIGDPQLLLLDEPLISLDAGHQRAIIDLVHEIGERLGIAVLFCSHEINPLLRAVDRVLYLGNGKAAIGSVDEVISGPVLSKLYGTHINVVRVAGRIFVMADDVELESGAHVHDL